MNKAVVFIQVQGKPGIVDAEIAVPAVLNDIHEALKGLGIEFDEESEIFIDESDEAESRHKHGAIEHLKHGSRIHVTRCKKIKVTVHFLDKTIEQPFPPGARVRSVKKWAVHAFHINPTDAGEHILQLCGTTKQPPTDTPLAELVHDRGCDVCFDFVPEKRVEG
jgi:hypothetical protein